MMALPPMMPWSSGLLPCPQDMFLPQYLSELPPPAQQPVFEQTCGEQHTSASSMIVSAMEAAHSAPLLMPNFAEHSVSTTCHLSDTTGTSAAFEPCFGCGMPITDRYFLLVNSQSWHMDCLKCCNCLHKLDSHPSCFFRDGLILCRDDYMRLYTKTCARCAGRLRSDDYVMKARELVFHVHCFSCALCHTNLNPGDYFALGRDATLYCRNHYEPMLGGGRWPDGSVAGNDDMSCSGYGWLPRPLYTSSKAWPIADGKLDDGTDCDRSKVDTPGTDKRTMSSSPDGSAVVTGNSSPAGRAKRMRTSFKHHQLRTMKAYFELNHNPDAKDLKHLAMKTGLTKRVLQVWFQNARAKFRRAMQLPHDSRAGEAFMKHMGGTLAEHENLLSKLNKQHGMPPLGLPPGLLGQPNEDYLGHVAASGLNMVAQLE